MSKTIRNSALDLALALKRYGRMKPENAYVALAKEWPQPIVAIISDILWREIPADRTLKDITRETAAAMRQLKAAHKAVAAVKCKRREPSRKL